MVSRSTWAVLVVAVLAVTAVLACRRGSGFRPHDDKGWLWQYGEFRWLRLPAFLEAPDVAPPTGPALSTLVFSEGSPSLVALEHAATKRRLVLRDGGPVLAAASATDVVSELRELWAIKASGESGDASGPRFEIRNGTAQGDWLALAGARAKARVSREPFAKWILEPSSESTNAFAIRVEREASLESDGAKVYLGVAGNEVVGTAAQTVWRIEKLAGPSTATARPAVATVKPAVTTKPAIVTTTRPATVKPAVTTKPAIVTTTRPATVKPAAVAVVTTKPALVTAVATTAPAGTVARRIVVYNLTSTGSGNIRKLHDYASLLAKYPVDRFWYFMYGSQLFRIRFNASENAQIRNITVWSSPNNGASWAPATSAHLPVSTDAAASPTIVYELVANTPKPEVTTKPAVATTRPAIVTTKPAVATTRPAIVTTKPVVATTRPAIVTTKPVTAKPATAKPVTSAPAVIRTLAGAKVVSVVEGQTVWRVTFADGAARFVYDYAKGSAPYAAAQKFLAKIGSTADLRVQGDKVVAVPANWAQAASAVTGAKLLRVDEGQTIWRAVFGVGTARYTFDYKKGSAEYSAVQKFLAKIGSTADLRLQDARVVAVTGWR